MITDRPKAIHTLFFKACLTLSVIYVLYLSTIRIDSPLPGGFSDKFYHALCFCWLAFLTHRSFPDSESQLPGYLFLFLYGIFIECVQFFLPYRSFSFGDMIADAFGIIIYYLSARSVILLKKTLIQKNQAP